MGKKLITSIVLLLLLCVSGCAVFIGRSGAPATTPVRSDIPSDTEIIEGMKAGKTPAGKVVGQQNEDILELKHWKYGSERAQPSVQQSTDEPDSLQSPGEPDPPQLPRQSRSLGMDEIGNWETVAIPILSEEEFEQILKQLIDLGYLKKPVDSELELQRAIRNFQKDHSLPVTGELDGSTRELIRGK
ncbi:MAG TPA: peptidoglycan-binding protein [Gelria sp.]|jgi:hypothetical protein|nr:peptidoglycan-binding protein [Gelria sp.]